MSSEQPKEYICNEEQLLKMTSWATNKGVCLYDQRLTVANQIRSRPHPAPAPKFNSTELLLLAHDEWKRREERKHLHNEQDWVSGFINGFLTDPVWARKMVDTIRANAQHPSTKGGEHL
jgi:hypothetical protein